MKLESFRHDEIGQTYFALQDGNRIIDHSTQVLASYISYSFQAFYLTMQDIEMLENAKGNLVPNGRHSITSVSLWFLSLEAYINTLLKLTCSKTNKNFDDYKKWKLSGRLSILLELLNIDTIKIKKTGLVSKINEFAHFRNEIFHDRNVGNQLEFHKTIFSVIPFQCNIIDVLQGLLIYLETASTLHLSITGLDSMPDILIHANNKAFHKKLDYLYLNLIKPSMEGILAKHNLTTELSLDIAFPLSETSQLFLANDVAAFLYADSPDVYKFNLNNTDTHITNSFFYPIVANEDIDSTQFRLGKYTLNENIDIKKNPLIDSESVIIKPENNS